MFKKTPLELFEKVVLRRNKNNCDTSIDNLEELNNKNNDSILHVLEERIKINEGFTLAGNCLVHLECPITKTQVLVKYIENVYSSMINNKRNQTIPLLGNSLKAKELTKTIIISHINSISTQNGSFSKYIQSAVEILTIFASDGENSYYGESIEFFFSEKFQLSGCRIISKLIDLDISRICGIFRILLSQSDPVLQHLGLTNKYLPEKNIELHQKFKNNLSLLGISWTEIQEIMELLSVIVLLDDLEFNTSQYIKAGQKASNIYNPELSKTNKKICKLLGIIQSRFQEFFTVQGNKKFGCEKVESLKKMLLVLCFDYLVNKINESLAKKAKELLYIGKNVYKISVIHFPNPAIKLNIDGVLSNLLIECQEFVAYENFLSLLSVFHEEKVSALNVSVPRCRYIIELFLDKNLGILYNFSSKKYLESLKSEVLGDSVYNKILLINDNVLTLNNSWGSNLYALETLQYQYSQFPDITYYELLKKSSNRLLGSILINFQSFTYQDYFTGAISELLYNSSYVPSNIVYCYKESKDLLNETSLISLLNISYTYIIEKTLISLENLKKLGYKPIVTDNFYFIDDINISILKKFLGAKYKLDDFSVIKGIGNINISGPKLNFYISPISNRHNDKKRSSSARSRPLFSGTASSCISKGSAKSLSKSPLNYKGINYSQVLKKIILIQSMWRCYKSKKYFKSLKLLHDNAKKIQSYWKGCKIRTKFNIKKILKSIIFIQKKFKKYYNRKNNAARIIQKYYLLKYRQRVNQRMHYGILRKNSQKIMNTEKRHKERMQRAQSAQKIHTFAPVLSKKTLELAKNANERENNKLRVEERLMLKEKQRIEKLENEVFKKKRDEKILIENAQKKVVGKVNNKFYEEEIQFVKEKKESMKMLKHQINQEQSVNCTFKPSTSTMRNNNSRSPMQTVQDLYNWNLQKMIKIEKTSQKNERDLKLQMVKPKALLTSDKIHKIKIIEESEKEKLVVTMKRNTSPYWPNR